MERESMTTKKKKVLKILMNLDFKFMNNVRTLNKLNSGKDEVKDNSHKFFRVRVRNIA